MATMATLLNGMLVLFLGHAAGHGILTVPHSKNNGYPGEMSLKLRIPKVFECFECFDVVVLLFSVEWYGYY